MRQQLIDVFKPDRTIGNEPFLFEYSDTDADRPLYIWLHYEAGLTGEWDIRNAYLNSFSVRMLAVDPAFYEDNQDVSQLVVKQSYSSSPPYQPLWKKGVDGKWDSIVKTTLNSSVNAIKLAPDGTLYLAGSDNPGVYKIFKWDGDTLTTLATLNASCSTIEVGLDGMVYVGGGFTTLNGSAMNFIAKYNPTTGVWSSLSTGADNSVNSICAAPNGQLYIGGQFTTLGAEAE